ncbi:MAG: RagB/SusD family nutrient uptake outer membrane protein [Cytophagales bacterium]|nr:RagB/SusD family nutrient uptake outer membrane protein [Cytophagales bacterium]
MKNKIIYILTWLCFSSCQEYLDIVPDNMPTIDLAFSSRTAAKNYFYTCYHHLPDLASVSSNPALSGGDEIYVAPKEYKMSWYFGGLSAIDMSRGLQNANNPLINYWSGGMGGKSLFTGIRDCNIFLEKVHEVPDLMEWEKERWIAEVKVIKAYLHYKLMQMYGPIPIADKKIPIMAPTEEMKLQREPISKVVDYIVGLIDEVVNSGNLPESIQNEATELGRFTMPAALAIKAKTLVLAASPIFNSPDFYADFVDRDGKQLIDNTGDPKKWERARNAVKEAIDACHKAGVELYAFDDPRDISDSTLYKMNIRGAVAKKWNCELIWGQSYGANTNLQELASPRFTTKDVAGGLKSLLSPSMRMAEMFYSENGVPIDEDKDWNYAERFKVSKAGKEDRHYLKEGHVTANLHFDREPRFYGSLGFDGCIWYGQGVYDEDKAHSLKMKAGQPGGKMITARFSYTGYLAKKLVNYENPISGNKYTVERYATPVIRLADLYLLYAEALNETGASAEKVFEYIDPIRKRVGLKGVVESWTKFSKDPGKPNTLAGRRAIIKQERGIELAFEGHRFWDIRRWLDAEKEYRKNIRGWNFNGKDTDDYYTVLTLSRQSFPRRRYLMPLKTIDVIINRKLVQNPGW